MHPRIRRHSYGASNIVAAALLFLSANMAGAATLFSETFSGAAPHLGYTGQIAGTQFSVTSGNVDIIGVQNGNLFSCAQNGGGNCLDLVGTPGAGSIASVPTFTLTPGTTYNLSFQAVLQGYSPTDPATTTFNVTLGSLSQTETANAAGASYNIIFTTPTLQNGARIGFSTLTFPDSVHGAVLSNVTLTTPIPEPETYAMMLAGLGLLCLAARRRKQFAAAQGGSA